MCRLNVDFFFYQELINLYNLISVSCKSFGSDEASSVRNDDTFGVTKIWREISSQIKFLLNYCRKITDMFKYAHLCYFSQLMLKKVFF